MSGASRIAFDGYARRWESRTVSAATQLLPSGSRTSNRMSRAGRQSNSNAAAYWRLSNPIRWPAFANGGRVRLSIASSTARTNVSSPRRLPPSRLYRLMTLYSTSRPDTSVGPASFTCSQLRSIRGTSVNVSCSVIRAAWLWLSTSPSTWFDGAARSPTSRCGFATRTRKLRHPC